MKSFTTDDIITLNDLIEDCISFYCEEHEMGAQLSYIMAREFIETKISTLRYLENQLDG